MEKSLMQKEFYAQLTKDIRSEWGKKYTKSIEDTIKDTLVDDLGDPVRKFIDYLQNTHDVNCVPENIASGLANLPLDKVWKGNNYTNITTTKVLPTGEKLDGKKAYAMILPYFTTDEKYTPEVVNKMGEEKKAELFKTAIDIAKALMKDPVEKTAVEKFKDHLNDDSMFFNDTIIPEVENGVEGAKKCKDLKTAKVHCPVRYKSMMKWFKFVRTVLSNIEPMTTPMFYFTGPKATTPNCPLKMVAKFNPSSGSQSFSGGGSTCARAAHYQLPFFLERPGPIYNAFSVAGHEGRPGHHTQVSKIYLASNNSHYVDFIIGFL